MSIIASVTVKIFLLLIVGFLTAKFSILNEEVKHSLSDLLVYVFLPANLLLSSQEEFSVSHLIGIGTTTVITVLYYIVVIGVCYQAGKLFLQDKKKRGIFALLVAFANTGFVGMSIIGETVPGAGMLYAAIYNCVFDIIYFSVGILLLQENEGKVSLKTVMNNPIIWISLSSVLLYVIPYRFPAVVTGAIEPLAGCMLPVSMLIIGAEIYSIRWKDLLSDRLAYVTGFLRMIFLPLVVFAVMLLCRIQSEVAMTVVLLTAMPSASLNVIMSRKYNAHPEYAAITIMQNTILMVISLPVFLYLCKTYLN